MTETPKFSNLEEYTNLEGLFDDLYDRIQNLETERDNLKTQLNKLEGYEQP